MGIYVTNDVGLSDGQSNVLLMTSVAAAVVGGFAWGRVVDRLGPKRTLSRVLGCWAVTLGTAALIPVAGLPPLLFFGVAALAGVSLGGTWAADRPYMLVLYPARQGRRVLGLYSMIGRFSAVVGPLLWAYVAEDARAWPTRLGGGVVPHGRGGVGDPPRRGRPAARLDARGAGHRRFGRQGHRGLRRSRVASSSSLITRLVGWSAAQFFRLESTGGPVPSGPVLVVADHPNSLVDPLIVFRIAGRPTRPLAKAPLFEHALVGPILRISRRSSRRCRIDSLEAAIQGVLSTKGIPRVAQLPSRVHHHRNPCSASGISVQNARNRCSASAGIGVQLQSETVFSMGRSAQGVRAKTLIADYTGRADARTGLLLCEP